ncbi:MAG TPA: VOC family protein [Gaiellaceae bacterium]|nr:VOC family protein [Gaiellaceae bacterium]
MANALGVERVDFITIPTRDIERSRAWYHEVLGLPTDPNNPEELTAGQVTLSFWDPSTDGIEFSPSIGGFALRVDDVDRAKTDLETKGVEFVGAGDSGVCKMAVCLDPDGNALILHRRYKPYEQG